MRRQLKVVVDVLDGMLKNGVCLTWSLELTVQWDCILRAGPVHPVSLDDLLRFRYGGVGWFHGFIHRVVVLRTDEPLRNLTEWMREDPSVRQYRWLRPDFVPPTPFLLTPGVSGVLAVRIDEEFRKAWLPFFCPSGQREASLEEFNLEIDGWLPMLPEISS